MSRNVHTLSTKYNVLFNGENAFNDQKKQIDDAYEDDFWNILPIEPLKIEEKLALPGPPGSKSKLPTNTTASTSQGFERAEEKAVKAIQKHSMNINASEKNKQIDDAYFLLGKSRYYDQRFVPALETFKYMIKKYPKSKLFNDARIWEAKTLIRLGNEDEAIYKLGQYLTKVKDLPYSIRSDAHTALALAYTKQDSVQQVINNLNIALLYTKNISENEKKAAFTFNEDTIQQINTLNKNFAFNKYNKKQATRNAFILAQLYRQQNKIDSSNIVFDKIAALRTAPYRYKIYAQIERAKNYNAKNDDTEAMLASLKKLTKNRDNRPYLDGIYYQLGKINLTNNNSKKAIDYFKKSILTKLAKETQKSYAYEALGNIYFDKANFQNAGSYYDSVLNITKNKNSKRIRRLIRKRKSLDEVIRLENIATKNDSILDLVSMTKEEQTNFFKKYIEKLKKKEEEEKIIAENKKRNNFGGFGGDTSSKQSAKSGGSFYFYNTQTVGFGQQAFQKTWGNRALEDNWRLSNKKAISNDNEEDVANEEESVDESRKYEIAYYTEKIPSDTKVLDSIATKRNKAYYNLGLIYKEQFNKYELATTRLEKLLTFSPKENLILPSYYHLYKSFEKFDLVKSDFYKDKITAEYPDSRYAQIINNPKISAEELDDKNSPEQIYKTVYALYLDESYTETLSQSKKYINQFSELPIIPKFELLKAHAIAKLEGKEPFIKALTFVLSNYPSTDEGKRAAEILAFLRGEKIPKKEEPKKEVKKAIKKRRETKNDKIKRNSKLPSKEEMMDKIKKRRKGKSMGPPGFGG